AGHGLGDGSRGHRGTALRLVRLAAVGWAAKNCGAACRRDIVLGLDTGYSPSRRQQLRRAALAGLGLAFTWLSLSGACADELKGTLQRIAQTKTIRLGYLKEAIPFSFAEQEGKPLGYSIDLCNRVVAGIQRQLNLSDLSIQWVEVTTANRFDKV